MTTRKFIAQQPIVFVFPIYAWQMPRVVRDFMDKGKVLRVRKKVYFIATSEPKAEMPFIS